MDTTKPPSCGSTPLLISIFVREFLAVGLLLLLESRIRWYDYTNMGLILFLILIAARMPYINSYAYFFETCAMPKWAETRAHGLKNDARESFNWKFFFTVLIAHVGGSIAAAAARVYLDAQYGMELIPGGGNGTVIQQGLRVNIDDLEDYSTSWSLTDRKRCFADNRMTGQAVAYFPLKTNLCISSYMMYIWYVGEEAVFVLLLCICYIHIWLGSGIADDDVPETKSPPNPFGRDYWGKLFKLSFILTFINLALLRAFPTAHGSLHNTVYYMYYEKWGANIALLDTENNEAWARIGGGFLGVLLAYCYSSALAKTDSDDCDPWMYRLWWGFDPKSKSVQYIAPSEQKANYSENSIQDFLDVFGQGKKRVIPRYPDGGGRGEVRFRIPSDMGCCTATYAPQ